MPALTILHLYSVHSNILTHNTILLRPHLIQPLLFFLITFSPAHIEKFMSSFPMFPPFYCVHVFSRSSGLLCVHYCKGEICIRDSFMALPPILLPQFFCLLTYSVIWVFKGVTPILRLCFHHPPLTKQALLT